MDVPAGLTDLLKGYTLEVLKQRPVDLLEFAVQHFTSLRERRSFTIRSRSPVTRGVAFDQDSAPTDEEEEEHGEVKEEEEEEEHREEKEEEEEEEEDDFPDDFTFKGGTYKVMN